MRKLLITIIITNKESCKNYFKKLRYIWYLYDKMGCMEHYSANGNSEKVSQIKSIVIFYFSATGNTERVVNNTASELLEQGLEVKKLNIEDQSVSDEILDLEQFDLIGLAYPIYGFGTPKIIDEFIDTFPQGSGKKLFLFKTGADFISINHNASFDLINELERKNYLVFYDRIIVMGSNWVLGYPDALVKQLDSLAEKKIKHMCHEILQLKKRRFKTGKFLKSLSLGISRLEKNYGSKSFGKSLRNDSNCTFCSICSKNCPRGNIQILNGSVIFGEKCIWCMRCVYNCPQNAIYSKGLNFCILKNGYDLAQILENEQTEGIFITKDTKGYYKHFIKYMNDESV